jgi:isopentenyldiphosphate isomerase
MTHPTYTQQALCRYNLPRLKRIATELGVTPTGDKRAAETWVDAIITHQSTQLQKVDEQATAQAELDGFIAHQVQAPESLTAVEISFYDHEFYALQELIASITHDDNLTQPWVVMVNGAEKFRANTWARCNRYITWHHQDGTLNEPVPTQTEVEETATTGNEIMAQIFNECEKYRYTECRFI